MKTIVSHVQKGGVGKTTTGVNIASMIGESSRACLVDGDIQGNATTWLLTSAPDFELADVLRGKATVKQAIVNVRQGLDIIPTFGNGGTLSQWKDIECPGQPKAMEFLVSDLKDAGYDYVIFDLGPGMSLFEKAVIAVADEVYTTLTPECLAVDGVDIFAGNLANIVKSSRRKIAHRLMVVNMVNGSYARHKVYIEKLKGFEYQILLVSQDARLAEAPMMNKVIQDYAPTTKTVNELRAIADFLTGGV